MYIVLCCFRASNRSQIVFVESTAIRRKVSMPSPSVELNIHHADYRSYTHNLNSCEIKARKKFRPERDQKLRPLRYWRSTVLTELSSQLGAGHVVSS